MFLLKRHVLHRLSLHCLLPVFNVAFVSNLAVVKILFKLGGCLLLFIILKSINTSFIFSLPCSMSIAPLNLFDMMGLLGLYVCTNVIMLSVVLINNCTQLIDAE